MQMRGVRGRNKVKPKTTAERVRALRERRAKSGLDRLEIYAPSELHERIKKYVAKLIAAIQREVDFK